MKKHLKVLRIEREGSFLEIWVKGNYNKLAKYFENKFYDEAMSFLGTYIDITGKYIILQFVLRNKEDILPYIKCNDQEKEMLKKALNCKEVMLKSLSKDTEFILLTKQDYERNKLKYSMDDQVDY